MWLGSRAPTWQGWNANSENGFLALTEIFSVIAGFDFISNQ
jgi:hypothetical protein